MVPPTSPRRPAGVADVLSALLSEPGRPRLTWYGPGGERIELSGAVLDNWVSKSTNLFVEELDAGPGTRVLIDLPPHWRTIVWALAAWRVGATVAVGAADGAADVAVSDRPGSVQVPRGTPVVAVALPALARAFDGDLPAGALDAAQSVMTYGDVIGWAPEVEPDRPALDRPRLDPVAHAGLVGSAGTAAGVPDGTRALLTVDPDRERTPATLLATLGVLAGGGSVVLRQAEPGDAAERVDRIADSERVTARLSIG